MTDLKHLSKSNQVWERHKLASLTIAESYEGSEYKRYAERIRRCAEVLKFQLLEGEAKLSQANFCRVRHCPICQWRRSLQWKARAYQGLPALVENFPTDRWLFLTLTVRNCPIEELRKNIDCMNKGYRRMTRRKAWCVRGWVRSTEVTRGQDRLSHPHFHCLLMIPASYFSGKKYLSHRAWQKLWQESMQIDYTPIIHVKALPRGISPTELVPEILKYQTKVSDITTDSYWLIELTKQLKGSRAITIGGAITDHVKKSNAYSSHQPIDKDLTGALYFCWENQLQSYLS